MSSIFRADRARPNRSSTATDGCSVLNGAGSAYQIDLTLEVPLGRHEVGSLLAKWQGRRRPLHENHITRLMRTGVRGIVLPSLLVGNRRVSTREACAWWVRAITAADAGERGIANSVVASLTSAQRATLRRHGIAAGGTS